MMTFRVRGANMNGAEWWCRSEHTLPVTSIHVGLGQANAIAVTASLDRSCKIWSLAQGKAAKPFTVWSNLQQLCSP